jgi:hypothetical protein
MMNNTVRLVCLVRMERSVIIIEELQYFDGYSYTGAN